ncbi:zf-DHHC-domain-containing protein [Macrolepiota fuliginosa MF-IS2]|uniref:Palmitoyltransferase n=1 Tax=Macrolepiota fuliginosa MF-IS2 TaxID=1400762 RepID=A0A9P5X8Q6_9AGAR|nr:zf-DHHC-domain-containing protein [Macrolepiota fuliginosa MF-IS2]
MICAQRVFRCFRALERLGDRITGAAGPYFVALAIILTSTGTVCFFDVIAPGLNYRLVTLPICILIALNLHMHYYYVCTVRPGFVEEPPKLQGHGLLWAKRRAKRRGGDGGVLTAPVRVNGARVTVAEIMKCRKCGQQRPERAHHCRICNRCVLKYDHHCPVRINQCVGLHNERHFVLFLVYLAISTLCYSVLGWPFLLESLGVTYSLEWPYHVPEVAFAMIYILAVVLCIAVGIMGGYHIWEVANGETSVEAQDHEVYRNRAKERSESTIPNSVNDRKRKNLELFFNIGDGGYPWYTLILPLRVMPYTDGHSWARRDGYDRHAGVRVGDELTDEEEG